MKRIFTFLLLLTLILSLSATALAAEVGVVEYRKSGLSFLPGYSGGSLRYPDDLFPELKNVMPGDVIHQQVKIVHKGSRDTNIVVYIKAEGSDKNENFISQMQLEVEHKGGHILYGDDYDATRESDWQRLASLAPGKSATLDLTLTVPKTLSAPEFEDTYGTVVWKFKVEEFPVDPNAPKTFDAFQLIPWSAVLILSAAALAVILRKRKI